MDTINVDTLNVEFTVWVSVISDDPNPVEKLLNCENTVDTISVDTLNVEFTVW